MHNYRVYCNTETNFPLSNQSCKHTTKKKSTITIILELCECLHGQTGILLQKQNLPMHVSTSRTNNTFSKWNNWREQLVHILHIPASISYVGSFMREIFSISTLHEPLSPTKRIRVTIQNPNPVMLVQSRGPHELYTLSMCVYSLCNVYYFQLKALPNFSNRHIGTTNECLVPVS